MLRIEITGLYGNSMFNFWGTAILFSTVNLAVPFYIPTNSVQGFQYLYIFTSTCFLVFDSNHPTGGEVVLISILPIVSDVEDLLMCLWATDIFFGEMSIQVLCPFLNQVVFSFLSLRSSLYILDITPSSDMICNYFLPSCGLSFYFVNSVFWCTKF